MTTEPQQSAAQRGGIPADSFANRLMLARAYAGHLSIRDAAEMCGLGRGAWTNWEKGAKPVDLIEIVEVIAEKLGVDFDWLLFGGELGKAEGRPLRRRRRDGPTTLGYHPVAIRLPRSAERPTNNRPKSRPVNGPARTGYVERSARRKRDR